MGHGDHRSRHSDMTVMQIILAIIITGVIVASLVTWIALLIWWIRISSNNEPKKHPNSAGQESLALRSRAR